MPHGIKSALRLFPKAIDNAKCSFFMAQKSEKVSIEHKKGEKSKHTSFQFMLIHSLKLEHSLVNHFQ